jgi:mono/diheme cytochrome c family protein
MTQSSTSPGSLVANVLMPMIAIGRLVLEILFPRTSHDDQSERLVDLVHAMDRLGDFLSMPYLGHHRWLRLKSRNAKPNGDVIMPSQRLNNSNDAPAGRQRLSAHRVFKYSIIAPFAVDLELAKKGESLFQENCSACHKPHNGQVYDMGTDLGRARVVSEAIAQGARASFTGICPPSRTVKMPPKGTPLNPCAEFENVSLENKAEFSMADPKAHDGYNALPLGGVWAQAR